MNRRIVRIDDPAWVGMRVDKFASEVLKLCSRSQIKQRLLEVRVNEQPAKLSHRLGADETIEIVYSDPRHHDIRPEKIELTILYEDDSVIIIDKPQGMVVHPAAGNFSGTLVQGLAFHCDELARELGVENIRPGIVHRLDKDTSGVLIAAKNVEAQEFLATQFRRKRTRKEYLALAKGRLLPSSGTIASCIRRDPLHRKRFEATPDVGKPSVTDYRVIRQWDDHALVSLLPRTGRTHQLRVHLQSIGHPILGDPVYSRPDPRFPEATLMLHAYRLTIHIPPSGEARTFRAPLPERFKRTILALGAPRTDDRAGRSDPADRPRRPSQ